jgi:hypothetical protein
MSGVHFEMAADQPYPDKVRAELIVKFALNIRQKEVLAKMSWWGRQWVRPRDVGGYANSHHSVTLRSLVTKGLVNMRWHQGPGGKFSRGRKTYQLTDSGELAARLCAEERDAHLLDYMAKLAARA